jgi:hypothetical protein
MILHHSFFTLKAQRWLVTRVDRAPRSDHSEAKDRILDRETHINVRHALGLEHYQAPSPLRKNGVVLQDA